MLLYTQNICKLVWLSRHAENKWAEPSFPNFLESEPRFSPCHSISAPLCQTVTFPHQDFIQSLTNSPGLEQVPRVPFYLICGVSSFNCLPEPLVCVSSRWWLLMFYKLPSIVCSPRRAALRPDRPGSQLTDFKYPLSGPSIDDRRSRGSRS